MRFIKYFSIIAIIFTISYSIRLGQPQYQSFEGNIFGTTYHIKIRASKKDKELHNKIKAELASVNKHMSVFEPDSEISKINQALANTPILLSEQMSYLLRQAHHVYHHTNGAFDPTVAPLVNIWGFGPDKKIKNPTSEEINQILAQVGFEKLIFDKEVKSIRKTQNNVTLNLSAIAKGYGVDKIADLIEKEGYKDYIVEIGGEIRASGFRDDNNTPWTVGLREPQKDSITNLTIDITNIAIATSGDYQNFHLDADGKVYSHLISPQTGKPIQTNLTSVTVFSNLCIYADAYATALMAMPDAEALSFADKHNIKAIFYLRDKDGKYIHRYSEAAIEAFGE